MHSSKFISGGKPELKISGEISEMTMSEKERFITRRETVMSLEALGGYVAEGGGEIGEGKGERKEGRGERKTWRREGRPSKTLKILFY
jgi:hypothetical protein